MGGWIFGSGVARGRGVRVRDSDMWVEGTGDFAGDVGALLRLCVGEWSRMQSLLVRVIAIRWRPRTVSPMPSPPAMMSVSESLIMIIPKRAPPSRTAAHYNKDHRRERQPSRSSQMRGVSRSVGADALGDEVEEDEVDGEGDDDEY